jgi:hypothetical protein
MKLELEINGTGSKLRKARYNWAIRKPPRTQEALAQSESGQMDAGKADTL